MVATQIIYNFESPSKWNFIRSDSNSKLFWNFVRERFRLRLKFQKILKFGSLQKWNLSRCDSSSKLFSNFVRRINGNGIWIQRPILLLLLLEALVAYWTVGNSMIYISLLSETHLALFHLPTILSSYWLNVWK